MHPIPQMRLTMRTTTFAFKGSTTIVNPVCITTVIGTMIPIPDDISVRIRSACSGGINLYLYGPSSMWIDPFGLAMWPSGQFNSWFNGQTADQIADFMSSKSTRELIKKALLGSGGMHEWFPVSMTAKAKEIGLNAETLKSWATPTVDVYFQNINDKGNIIQGPHPSRNSCVCRARRACSEMQ